MQFSHLNGFIMVMERRSDMAGWEGRRRPPEHEKHDNWVKIMD